MQTINNAPTVTDAAIVGRKTFFVGATPTVLPEIYLENFIARGYETYRVLEPHGENLLRKLELIIALYKGSTLFFCIDTLIDGLDWVQIVHYVLQKHRNEVSVGILYNRRGLESENLFIKRLYNHLGVQCGCIPLSYQRGQNFQLLDSVLAANNVCGRRKLVRALCGSTSTALFFFGIHRVTAELIDISMNHFSCLLPESEVKLSDYKECSDILLQIDGNRFRAGCKLHSQRKTADGVVSVFTFIKRRNGTVGVDEEMSAKLCTKIYQMITEQTNRRLQDAFAFVLKYRNDNISPSIFCARVMSEFQKQRMQERAKLLKLSA